MPIDQGQVAKLSAAFDSYRFTFEGVEAWSARDLQGLLGYDKWENFRYAIQRAMEACARADREPSRHFVPLLGKLDISPDRLLLGVRKYSRGQPREEVILSRFAAYLVAMNGDPSKEEIAFAQAYFAIQTRKAEVLQERLAETERLRARQQLTRTESAFNDMLLTRCVHSGYALIRSAGDRALFGGFSTKAMKRKLGCPPNTPLANYLQTVLIWAKGFAAWITVHNAEANNLLSKHICDEHVENNKNVRGALLKSKIVPESLPAAENTTKVQQRHSKDLKLIAKDTEGLPLLVNRHEN